MSKNELDILLPESDITINGETIEIKPFPFSKLPKVINILSKMGAAIYSLFEDKGISFTKEGNLIMNQAFLESVSNMIEEHFPTIVELIAVYTDKEPAFYNNDENGLSGEDGLVLLAGIIERNYDFFTKRLAPALTKIKKKQR